VTDDDTFFSKEMLFDGLEIPLETIRRQPGFLCTMQVNISQMPEVYIFWHFQ